MTTFLKWYRLRLRFWGAAIYVHWSVLVVIAVIGVVSIKSPIHAAVAIASYLGMIVIHEIGHAFVARRLGYEIYELRIGFCHGCCEHEHPDTELEDAWIAWGGALAQLCVAIPVLVIGALTEDFDLGYAAPMIAFLGYVNLLVALINLAPAEGLDGQRAWRVVPLAATWWRASRSSRKLRKSIRRRGWGERGPR